MASRKSYIEIGWKLDKSGLREANRLTDDLSHTERSAAQGGKEIAAGLDRVGRSAQTSKSRVNEMGNGIDSASRHAIKLRDIFKGTLIGSATVSGVHALLAGVGSLSHEMTSNAKAWQTFTGNMQAFGESGKQIKKVKGDLQDFAVKTIYSASEMASTYSQLKATGTKNTEALVKGFGGLAAASDNPMQAMKSLSQQATQMAALPKVQWADLRIMMQQAPAGISAVSKAMGMSTDQLVAKVHAGTLTTKEFLAGITKAGNSPSFQKMATQYKTWDQAVDGLRENLANQASPAFNKLNRVAIKAISGINDALTGVNGKKLANDMDPYINKMESFMDYVGKNGDSLAEIGKDVLSIGNNLGKGAWNVIGTTINVLGGNAGKSSSNNAKQLADSMDSIASHKAAIQTIGGVFATYFVASKMLAFAKSLREVALGLGLVKAAESGTTTGGILSGVGSGSWVLGGIKTNRSKLVKEAAENAPEVGSRVVRNSLAGRIGTLTSKVGSSKLGSALGGVKAVGSKIPYLDIAMAGTSLIGMNKKNVGSKVGDFAGTLGGMEAGAAGGAALGSVVPGVGNAVGGLVGGAVGAIGGSALGKKLGKALQPQISGLSKTLAPTFKKLKTWFSDQWADISSGTKSVFSPIVKQFAPVSKAFGRMVSSIKKSGFGKALSSVAGSGMKLMERKLKTGFGGMKAVFKLGWSSLKTITGGAFKILGAVVSGGLKTVKGIFKVFDGVFSLNWKKTWDGIKDIASGTIGTLIKVIKAGLGIVTGLVKDVKNAVTGMHKVTKSESDGIAATAYNNNQTLNSIGAKKGVPKQAKPKIKITTGFATGGSINRNQLIAANEAGTEVAYDPRTAKYRLLGNGPVFAHVKAGERIINARDTAKMFGGGLGTGKTLPGYAAGTGALPSSGVGGVRVQTTKIQGAKGLAKSYDKETKQSRKSLTKFNSDSNKTLKSITANTKKNTYKQVKNTIDDYDKMQKGAFTQMHQMNKQVDSESTKLVKNYGSNIGHLDNYSHTAMSNAIGQLNKGFGSVNGVLSQFGDGSPLKLAHYAQGSHGPIENDQFAVLNDAKSGPTQEMIVRGGQALKPQGRNTVVPLKRGDEVLTGHEVERLPHYAKGTDGLKRVIETKAKDPSKAYVSDFASKLGTSIGSRLATGINKNDKGASTTVGQPWYKTAWNVLTDAMSGGAGGPITHSPGSGWSVTSGFGNRGAVSGGFSSHDGVDYSGGSVVHAMNSGKVTHAGGAPAGWGGGNGIGENVVVGGGGLNYIYQELNGKSNSGAKLLVSVGDTVKAGQAIAELGPSGTHVHVGATHHPMFSIGGSSTAGWLDPRTVKGTAVKGAAKKDSGLTKLVKKQLSSQIKYVAKNLSDDLGAGGTSPAATGSHKHWMEQAGMPSSWFSGVNEIVNAESGWNPHAQNASGAYGLPQSLPGSKMASAGSDWRSNPITQLKWMKSYINSRYGGISQALSFRHAHNWYAKGGHPTTGQNVVVGEDGPELARFEQPATIYSNKASAQVAGGIASTDAKGAGRSVNVKLDVHVTGAVSDGKKAGEQIGTGIVAKLRTMFNAETDDLRTT